MQVPAGWAAEGDDSREGPCAVAMAILGPKPSARTFVLGHLLAPLGIAERLQDSLRMQVQNCPLYGRVSLESKFDTITYAASVTSRVTRNHLHSRN